MHVHPLLFSLHSTCIEYQFTCYLITDVIRVVQHVSPIVSIRRKINQQIIPKWDITLVDETYATLALTFFILFMTLYLVNKSVVSLWNHHATSVCQELFDMGDNSPIVAIKQINNIGFDRLPFYPIDEYSRSVNVLNLGHTSFYNQQPIFGRGQDIPLIFSLHASMIFINPHQTMSYPACNTCKKKVTKSGEKGYWCDHCQHHYEESFTLRVCLATLSAKFSDAVKPGFLYSTPTSRRRRSQVSFAIAKGQIGLVPLSSYRWLTRVQPHVVGKIIVGRRVDDSNMFELVLQDDTSHGIKLRLRSDHHAHFNSDTYRAIMQKFVIYVGRVKLVHQDEGCPSQSQTNPQQIWGLNMAPLKCPHACAREGSNSFLHFQKQRKRSQLRNWKWDDVIHVDSDEKGPTNDDEFIDTTGSSSTR
ncbi:hypothetical protein OSB04_031256 [Centaurea solstitialis]|uniref:Replication factor A C-terminal domain-containing protein n=1 Tax=Centaurea solstitialis TaxID=347529 RepID=A0AA38SUC0_9ASTR|nr:hypothetical protein OSB04_031256 [Centaurea solstitialis]